MSQEWFEGRLVVPDGTSLHYARSPGAGPTWIYLHGLADSGAIWRRVAERMPGALDVVLLDSRNHGNSGGGLGGHENHVADVISVIEELRVPEVILVGHSIGARTALGVGACRPDLVSLVVLLDPPFMQGVTGATRDGQRVAARQTAASWSNSTPSQLFDLARRQHPQWDEADYPAWVESKLQVRAEAADDIGEVPWRDLALRCDVEAVLVFGDEDLGGLVTGAIAEEFTRLARKSRSVRIPGCGHNMQRENFEGTLDLLAGEWSRPRA